MKIKKGFTMVETLLVMGLAAIIIIAIFMIYPKVQSYIKVNQETRNIHILASGIRTLYASKTSYSGVANQSITDAGIVPDSMLLPANSGMGKGYIYNSWKGQVILSTSNKKNATSVGTLYHIAYYNVPDADCVKLITSVSRGFYWIISNGTTIVGPDNEFNPSSLGSACSANNKNYITFSGE